MDKIFNPKSIAVIGVSKSKDKVGRVIFENLKKTFKGKLYCINPHEKSISGKKCYTSVLNVKEKIDMAVIAIPALKVIDVVKECNKKGIKSVVIITAGFSEIGKNNLELELKDYLDKNNMIAVGPNCLGILDNYSNVDTLFAYTDKLKRPKKGNLSFISQSGAAGCAILDMLSNNNTGISKFVSYGNAVNVDESDYLKYLSKDKNTKVICVYLEAVEDGKKFMKISRKVSKKKPIVLLKGGKFKESEEATLSHTGSMAGSSEVYSAAFKQSGIIEVNSIREMFDTAKLLEKKKKPKGNKIQIITNGGGYGIITTDNVLKNNLKLSNIRNKEKIKKKLLPIAVVKNPIDLTGSANDEHYKIAIENSLKDKDVDILVVILLPQLPSISKNIVNIFSNMNKLTKKPFVVIMTGGESNKIYKEKLEEKDIPVYDLPNDAINSIKNLIKYNQ